MLSFCNHSGPYCLMIRAGAQQKQQKSYVYAMKSLCSFSPQMRRDAVKHQGARRETKRFKETVSVFVTNISINLYYSKLIQITP